MYVILLRDGRRVCIIGMHVVAVEADGPNSSTVVMSDGTRYPTFTQMEQIVQAVMTLRQNEVRG